MNLPNKLTLFRVILIPFFVTLLLLYPDKPGWRLTADAIFIIASLTDLLDGKIARKYNLVTNFGKFMDPLADKLLVSAAMICLIELGQMPSWVVIIIISREFIISGFRLIAATDGIVIAASYWGKFKTAFTMVMLVVMIANFPHPYWQMAGEILMWISLALTVVSLVDYMVKNKNVLKDADNV